MFYLLLIEDSTPPCIIASLYYLLSSRRRRGGVLLYGLVRLLATQLHRKCGLGSALGNVELFSVLCCVCPRWQQVKQVEAVTLSASPERFRGISRPDETFNPCRGSVCRWDRLESLHITQLLTPGFRYTSPEFWGQTEAVFWRKRLSTDSGHGSVTWGEKEESRLFHAHWFEFQSILLKRLLMDPNLVKMNLSRMVLQTNSALRNLCSLMSKTERSFAG